jgi:hypothetical protein
MARDFGVEMFYRSTIMARCAGERRAVSGSNVEVLRDRASKVMDRKSRTLNGSEDEEATPELTEPQP